MQESLQMDFYQQPWLINGVYIKRDASCFFVFFAFLVQCLLPQTEDLLYCTLAIS